MNSLGAVSLIEFAIMCFVTVVALAFYNAFLIIDDRTPENHPDASKINRNWHIAGGTVFFCLGYTYARLAGWEVGLFVIALFWSLFAGIVHIIALKKAFFFVGTTAFTDKVVRRFATLLKQKSEHVAMVLKTGFLLFTIYLVFLK